MRKTHLLSLLMVLSVFASCKKENTVTEITMYLSGNEDSKSLIYEDDKVLYNLGKDCFVSDVTVNGDGVYSCGYMIVDGTETPMLWRNGDPSNNALSTQPGKFNKIIAVTDKDVYAVGGVASKGVLVLNGTKVYEYGNEGQEVEFESFLIDNIGRVIIACNQLNNDGTQEIKIVIVAYDSDKKAYVPTQDPIVYTESVMNYSKYMYDIKGVTLAQSSGLARVCLAMNRFERENPENTSACYTKGADVLGVLGNDSAVYSIFGSSNTLYIGGCTKKDGKYKACMWVPEFGTCEDFSIGYEGKNSAVYCQGAVFGSLVSVICGEGKLQYQINNSVAEAQVSTRFVPTGLAMKLSQRVVTE